MLLGKIMVKRYFQHLQKIALTFCLSFSTVLLITPQQDCVAETTSKGKIDWIMVIDTSASMRGVGNTKNIFKQVKATVTNFINTTNVGDSITIYTFERDTVLRSSITIKNNADRGNLKKIINGLQANGQRTYMGQAVQQALKYSGKLSKSPEYKSRTTSIVFFTDGLEDVRNIPNPIGIPKSVDLVREQKCKPYVFFISLGERVHEKQLDDFVNHPSWCGKGEVIRDPGANNLLAKGDRIRQVIQPTLQVKVQPNSLEFDNVEVGKISNSQTITITSTEITKIQVALENINDKNITLIEPTGLIQLNRGEEIPVPIVIKAEAKAEVGDRQINLLFIPQTKPTQKIKPTIVEAYVNIVSPSWQRVFWFYLPLSLLLGCIIVVVWLIYSPGNLEGALELLHPQLQNYDSRYIDLTKRKRQRLKISELLSGLLSESLMPEADAELFIVRQQGQKKLLLRRTQGTVSINDVEIVLDELYEGDKISLNNIVILELINTPTGRRFPNNQEYEEFS